MSSFYKRLKAFFGFSKREMNGAIGLIFLIIIALVIPSLYTHYFSLSYNRYEDQQVLDSLLVEIMELENEELQTTKSVELFAFDPNSLSLDSFKLLGLPVFLSERIMNYREAGGVFFKPSDLQKIYGMPDSLYSKLEEFIKIERVYSSDIKKEERVVTKETVSIPLKSSQTEPLLIKINTADALDFQKLKGIGPVYSERIVKFRRALGGFNSLAQVSEVYGISDSLYRAIKSNLVLDTIQIHRIAINLASFKEVNRHPYISYRQTQLIFNAKSKVGKFRSTEDFIVLQILDSLSAYRLEDYLDFR